jgi:hypothetical protein
MTHYITDTGSKIIPSSIVSATVLEILNQYSICNRNFKHLLSILHFALIRSKTNLAFIQDRNEKFKICRRKKYLCSASLISSWTFLQYLFELHLFASSIFFFSEKVEKTSRHSEE